MEVIVCRYTAYFIIARLSIRKPEPSSSVLIISDLFKSRHVYYTRDCVNQTSLLALMKIRASESGACIAMIKIHVCNLYTCGTYLDIL